MWIATGMESGLMPEEGWDIALRPCLLNFHVAQLDVQRLFQLLCCQSAAVSQFVDNAFALIVDMADENK
jgi:hypothetical protein